MAKRRPQARPASPEDLELFASFVRGEERAQREAKAAEKAARREAAEQDRLHQAKEAAAAEVKRLRGSERATPEQKAAADAAYKAALAAVVAAETGAAPTWAPVPSADEPGASDEPEAIEAPDGDDAPEAPEAPDTGGAPSPDEDGQ